MTTYKKTAEEFKVSAADHFDAAAESFERCDTDGFVSQWAHGICGERDRVLAQIVEKDKTAVFVGLFEGNRRVKARTIETQFGTSWVLHDDEVDLIAKRGKVFLPYGYNSRILKNLGLEQRDERAPAWAKLDGRGTGLSGRVWVAIFRTGDKWGPDAKEEAS